MRDNMDYEEDEYEEENEFDEWDEEGDDEECDDWGWLVSETYVVTILSYIDALQIGLILMEQLEPREVLHALRHLPYALVVKSFDDGEAKMLAARLCDAGAFVSVLRLE